MGKILTIDVIMRRWLVANTSSLYKAREELANHILIYCDRIRKMRDMLLAIFGL